jgi:hypothetical protein
MARTPSDEDVAAALTALGVAPTGGSAQLIAAVAAAPDPPRPALKLAVRLLVQQVAERAPGHTVELRVPPYAAVQCVAGPRHTRGTPPNVVEVEPVAFVALMTGALTWDDALRDGRLRASGERVDLLRELLRP